MKRIALLALTIFLAALMVGMANAAMYWDTSEELDEDIPDREEVTPPPAPVVPSVELPPPVKMYDDYEVPDIESGEEEEEVVTIAAPIPSSAVDSPSRRPAVRATTSTTPAPVVAPREPAPGARGPTATTIVPRREVAPQSPQPVPSTPGAPVRVTPGDPAAAQPSAPADVTPAGGPPAPKKMQWGSVGGKPAEPTTSR